jgi:hypothetical protein
VHDAAETRASLPAGELAGAAANAIAGARASVDALAALELVRPGPREAVAQEVDAFGVQVESATNDALRAIEAERQPAEPPDFEVGLAGLRATAPPDDPDVGLVLTELEHLAAGVRSLLEGVDGVTRALNGAERPAAA